MFNEFGFNYEMKIRLRMIFARALDSNVNVETFSWYSVESILNLCLAIKNKKKKWVEFNGLVKYGGVSLLLGYLALGSMILPF